jgi:hypothetical protein
MAEKLRSMTVDGVECYVFHCPGCKFGHRFEVGNGRWTFNGDLERPTFTPSLVSITNEPICHLFMRDGKIEFLSDSKHELAGQTVDCPDWD